MRGHTSPVYHATQPIQTADSSDAYLACAHLMLQRLKSFPYPEDVLLLKLHNYAEISALYVGRKPENVF